MCRLKYIIPVALDTRDLKEGMIQFGVGVQSVPHTCECCDEVSMHVDLGIYLGWIVLLIGWTFPTTADAVEGA